MRASKETAREAKTHLTQLRAETAPQSPSSDRAISDRFAFLYDFIEAAIKKLPSESAYDAEEQRNKARKLTEGRRVRLLPWEAAKHLKKRNGKIEEVKDGVYTIRRDDGKIVHLDIDEIEGLEKPETAAASS